MSTQANQTTGISAATPPPAQTGASLASSESTAAAPASKDGFKRTLNIFDMVIYGLIFMVPIAPFSIYAGVANASGNMAMIAYLIAFVAMLFTVLSFGVMIRTFPSSGSIYTYTSHSLGKGIGFVAGWLMLLQYMVTPDMVFTMAGEALNQYVPAVPVWAWCLGLIVFVLIVATRGMQTTMTINKIALVMELIVLGMFFVFGIHYILANPDTAGFTTKAVFNPEKFSMSGMMGATSLAVFSFVGFGCVATLTDEAKNPRHGPSKAMFIMVVILAVLFAGTCYIAACVDPSGQLCASNPNNGFYLIAERVGGTWFGTLCAIAVALAQGVFTGLVGLVSVSRILCVMGQSGSLPKPLAKINKRNVPIVATLFVVAFSLVFLPLVLIIGMDGLATVVNFGALSTYMLLNICVIVYYWVRKKDHHNPIRILICPAIGALVVGYVFFSLNPTAHLIGCIWIAIGIVYYLVMTRVLKREVNLGQ